MILPTKPTKPRPRRPLEYAKRTKDSKNYNSAAADASSQKSENSSKEDHLNSASLLLQELIQAPETKDLLDPNFRANSRMVYTNGVTIWLLILQRLNNAMTLEETVTRLLQHDRDLLPDNKRVRDFTLSENTSGYSNARQKLELNDVREFSNAVCNFLARTATPSFDSRRVFLLDGTTITLAPTPSLAKAYPPAPNQHGTSVWPVAMLMVAAEMNTGCVLVPQIDPMYGPDRSSEAKQARRVVEQLPPNSIVMADAGFGIFSVAYHSTQAGHDFHFRLTHSRFEAFARQAMLLDSSGKHSSYQLHWTPSVKDRSSNPDLPDDASVDVRLHKVQLDNGEWLYLVSTLGLDAIGAAELYSRRYDVEFDIRDLKVTMDAENIRARSVAMMEKELLTSVVGFNMVSQFRRQAAKLAGVEPRRLSFKGVWTSFKEHLLLRNTDPKDFESWSIHYTRALISASDRKLPNRSKPRSFPRKAHPRRPKSTKFMKKDQPVVTDSTEVPTTQPLPMVRK